MEQKMSSLPPNRVIVDEPPFTFTGLDCFGPFYVKQGRSQVKRYGLIFTCLNVRAIHLEILSSMDTDSFIQALRRFLARRGLVKEICCDNGTNFVGASNELQVCLKKWNSAATHEFLLQKGIVWKFNTPSASHQGGVWERCIRSVRKLLIALTKEQNVNDEGLHTLFCEVESILNGRPLTASSSDPRDLEPITPNHLLLMKSENVVPPDVFVKTDNYCRRRWRQIQYMADVFWRRWTREYLPLLQQRQKWLNTGINLSKDDVVLVMDDQSPRNFWPLGRVMETFPDKNGLVRRVKVKNKLGEYMRPRTKLCLLESHV